MMQRIIILVLVMLGMAVSADPAIAARARIAAIVGEDVITNNDIDDRRALIMATAGIPDTPENTRKLTPRIIQSLIDETLQLQEAKRQSLTVTDEELSKAINEMSASRAKNGESLRAFVKERGLSERSMENQVRAQLAWTKVVQRKLRRNVTISQDEIERAQKSAAASPGDQELRISGLEVEIPNSDKEAEMGKLAEQMALKLKAGTDMQTLALRYIKQPAVRFNPPTWVPEKSLPIGLQQGLRSLKPGEATPPLRNPRAFQILQVLERRTVAKQADATEFAIKQLAVTLPKKRDKASLTQLQEIVGNLRKNPGSCTDESLPKTALPTEVKFVRAKLGSMSPEQRSIVGHLEVGDVSEPLSGPDAVRLVMVCEKIEPSTGNLPNVETVRQQLFSDKIELEAQKHLRNLRRDAFIDIKDVTSEP